MRARRVAFIGLLVLVSAGLLVVGCDSGSSGMDDDPPQPPPPDVSEEIGPDGGTVSTADGRLTLTIPEGALASTETITIDAMTTSDLGSEFDAVTDQLGIENAYELGPDGLSFDQPVAVRFITTQAPAREADSLAVSAEFLFTADNGSVEALDNLRTAVDTSANEVVVTGQMDHFTPLTTSKANNGVSFFVFDVPESREVDDPFDARAVIQASMEGPSSDLVTLEGPAEYTDESSAPVEPSFGPGLQELSADGEGGFEERFTYSCAAPGLGVFGADLAVQVTFNLDSGAISAESFANFITTIECTEAPPELFALTVQKDGDGSGTVLSQPDGINCGVDCSQDQAEFEEETSVALVAEPADGSNFAGWGGDIGDAAAEDSVITLTMNQARTVTATFEKESVPKITLFDATRTGLPLEFEAEFEFEYDGTPDEVTAEIDPGDGQEPQEVEFELSAGNTFTGSEMIEFGEAGDYTTGLTVVSPDGSDEATIEHQKVTVTIEKDGSGSGTVAGLANTTDPTELFSCGEECTMDFEYNPNAESYPPYALTLEAKADDNSVFDGWSGNVPPECEGSTDPCATIMNQDRTVTATFNTKPEAAAAIQKFDLVESTQLEGTFEWEVQLMSGGNPENLEVEAEWGDGTSSTPDLGEQVGSDPPTFEGQTTHKYELPGLYDPSLTLRYEGAVTAEASIEYVTSAPPTIESFTGELIDLRTVQFGFTLQWAGPLGGIQADFDPTGGGEAEPVFLSSGDVANTFVGEMEYFYGADVQFPVVPTISATNDASGESSSESSELQLATLTITKDGPGFVEGLRSTVVSTFKPIVINCGQICEEKLVFETSSVLGTFSRPVELSADPDDGYVFSGWDGNLVGSSACEQPSEDCIKVPMNQDRTINATFNPTLTVQKDGEGDGNVTSNPGDIDLQSGVSSDDYENGTEVTLTATPGENISFGGWSGDIGSAPPNDPILKVTMDQARTVTATFEATQIEAELGVGVIASPQGGIPVGETGTATVELENNGPDDAPDTAIMLETDNGQVTGIPGNEIATCDEPPASEIGCSFNEDIPAGEIIELIFDFEAETPGTLTLNSAVSTSASDPDESNNSDQVEIPVEEPTETFTLTVQKDGEGEGTVTSDPAGIDLGSDGTEEYEEGTDVSLTATPDEDSDFGGWSGDIGSAPADESTLTVTMDQARTITATFEPTPQGNFDMAIDLTGVETPLAPGETGTMNVVVNNIGDDPATNVEFVLQNSNGTIARTPIDSRINCDPTPAAEITCSFTNPVPGGDINSFLFDFQAGDPGLLIVSGSVSPSDSNPGNNSDEEEVTVE